MTLLIVLGSILAYFVVGAVCVKAAGPLMWRKAQGQWGSGESGLDKKYSKESVVAQSAAWLFLWPFVIPWTFTIGALEQVADDTDPAKAAREAREREQQIKDQQVRIAELERELGINRAEP